MACTHNQVIDGLAADITSYLGAAYNSECRCYRLYTENLDPPGANPIDIQPGSTPAVWINEARSELTDDHHSYFERVVHIQLEGLIRFNTTNVDAGIIQQQLNELEAVLDRVYNESCLAGGAVKVAYTVFADGDTTYYVGDDSGVILVPLALQFRRLANGT